MPLRTTCFSQPSPGTGESRKVVERLADLNRQHDWERLTAEAEKRIAESPGWLLPYVFAGIGHVMNGDRPRGIARLEFAAGHGGAQRVSADVARRVLDQILVVAQ